MAPSIAGVAEVGVAAAAVHYAFAMEQIDRRMDGWMLPLSTTATRNHFISRMLQAITQHSALPSVRHELL